MDPIICKALLFDMDGVLIDSTHAVARVWTNWALEHGFDPVEVVHRAHGRPSLSTVKDYLPNADHEAENLEVERREVEDLEGVVSWPGALELLSSLPGHRWAIVTSCTRKLAEVRLKAAGLPRPNLFITSSDVVNGKPAPDPYLKGAAMLGFDPVECVVVEDVAAGVKAGKAAGCRVIGLRTTVRDQELVNAGADWVVDNCGGIRAAVRPDGLELTLTMKAAASRP
ncbi:MAG TPA: HAD-IA family hydrolase [Terriglobales bacterium]|nr:HAD-IA family hydrolase [Terriglobales bacterium]